MHHSSQLPQGRASCIWGPSPGCCGGGGEASVELEVSSVGSAGAELVPGGVDRSLVTTDSAQPDPPACSSAPHNQLLTPSAIVKIKTSSIFTASLFRSSEPNNSGGVIIGVRINPDCKIMFGSCKKTAGEQKGAGGIELERKKQQ